MLPSLFPTKFKILFFPGIQYLTCSTHFKKTVCTLVFHILLQQRIQSRIQPKITPDILFISVTLQGKCIFCSFKIFIQFSMFSMRKRQYRKQDMTFGNPTGGRSFIDVLFSCLFLQLECMPDGAPCNNDSFSYHIALSSIHKLRGYSVSILMIINNRQY